MGHDERGRHDLEAEDALRGGPLDGGAGERAGPASRRLAAMRRRDFGQVRARAAAGVEHVDVVGGESGGDAKVVLEGAIDAGDHVADDFGGGVPDAQLLAQGGVEGLQERLVEVGHGLALI